MLGCRGTGTVLTEMTGIFAAIFVALKQSRTE
jgi:preprotein translocase subunit SecG